MSGLADIRDIFRGAVSSLFGFGGRVIARAILMVVAGRWFGMAEVGVLGQVAAITEMAAAFGVLGLKRSLLDMLSEDFEHGRMVEKRVVEALLLATVVGILLSGILFFLWPVFIPALGPVRWLLLLAIPAIVFTEVALSAIKYKRIIRWDVLSRGFTEPWGFLGLTLVLLGLGQIHNGLVMAYTGSVLISVLTVAIGLVKTYGGSLARARPSLSRMLAMPGRSLPTGMTDLGVMMLRRMDILILGLFVPDSGTGLYYMVQQLATIPQKINALFEPMMSPVIARLHNQFKPERIRANLVGICRWIFILQIGLTVPMIVFGDKLLALFGPEFAAGWLCLSLVLVAELIDGSFITCETPLLFTRPKIPPLVILTGLVVEAVAIALLSRYFGVTGAATGFLIALLTISIGRLWALAHYLHIRVINRNYILPALLAAGFALLLYGLRQTLGAEHAVLVSFGTLFGLTMFLYLIKIMAMTKSDRIILRAFTQRSLKKRRAA